MNGFIFVRYIYTCDIYKSVYYKTHDLLNHFSMQSYANKVKNSAGIYDRNR